MIRSFGKCRTLVLSAANAPFNEIVEGPGRVVAIWVNGVSGSSIKWQLYDSRVVGSNEILQVFVEPTSTANYYDATFENGLSVDASGTPGVETINIVIA